jgi:hypothetical protein
MRRAKVTGFHFLQKRRDGGYWGLMMQMCEKLRKIQKSRRLKVQGFLFSLLPGERGEEVSKEKCHEICRPSGFYLQFIHPPQEASDSCQELLFAFNIRDFSEFQEHFSAALKRLCHQFRIG